MTSRRLHLVGAVLSALSAALLVFGAWSTAWWSGEAGGVAFSVGPRFAELCREGPCQQSPLEPIGGLAWMRTGIGALSSGLVGAALLAAAAARRLWRPEGKSALPGAAGLACGAAVILGVAFVWIAPAEVASLELGSAVVAFFAGGAIGAGSAALLRP